MKLNEAVTELNTKERGAKVRHFTKKEFLVGLGIMIAVAGFNCRGCELWAKAPKQDPLDADPKTWGSIIPSPDFGRYMGENRFKEYRKLIPKIWQDKNIQDSDPWWEFSAAVKEFNQQRSDLITASKWKVEDESMSAWCPRKSKTGGLPNISYVIRKPEPLGKFFTCCCCSFTPLSNPFLFPLGTEFKNIACCRIGCILALEIQRGKEGMRAQRHCATLGATAACTLRLMEEAQDSDIRVGAGVRGDAWFGSVKAATALAQNGYKAVLQVKTGHGLFPKKFIEDALKDAPGGVWIVLQSTYQDVPLVAIGYRYSTRTTLHFVATKNAGSTSKGNPYRMKYTDDWGNIHIRDVDRPDLISKFFEFSNIIDKHNQARQAELALEKRWLTQNPYFRLHTTIIGLNVVDCYKLADHHKMINHRIPDNDYKMTMTCFAGILANQLITNVDSLLSFYSPLPQELRSLTNGTTPAVISISNQTPETASTITSGEMLFLSLRVLTDANQVEHHQIAYDKTTGSTGKRRTKTRPCSLCLSQENKRRLVGFGCYTCGLSLCCPSPANNDRDCFLQHVRSICRRTNRQLI